MRNDWQSKLVLPEWRTSRVSREPRVHLLLFPRERKDGERERGRERDSLTDLHSYTLDNSTRTLSLLQRSFHLRQLFPRRRRRRRRRRCESRNTSTGNSVAGFSCINDERNPPHPLYPSRYSSVLTGTKRYRDAGTILCIGQRSIVCSMNGKKETCFCPALCFARNGPRLRRAPIVSCNTS